MISPPPHPGLGGLQGGLGQHGVRVSYTDQVVNTEGSSHGASTEVLVLVLTQSGNGLKAQKHIYIRVCHAKTLSALYFTRLTHEICSPQVDL